MSLDVSKLWEINIAFLWGDEFVTGLEAFLQHSSVVTILDSCGGVRIS